MFEACHCVSTWKATGSLGGLNERTAGTKVEGQGATLLNDQGPYLNLEKGRL